MKISLNWLKHYASLNLEFGELIAKIGSQLGAIEEVDDERSKYDNIRVVQIREVKPHPNADKLNVYQMTDGREQVRVVSGDKNLNVGDKVAWLAPGTVVPSTYSTSAPVLMEARPLRGEISQGMFGSGKELGFNTDHEGVLKLDTDAKPGTLLAAAYDLDDVIINIENKMFTHRPDCFGLIGVAREIAGIQGLPFKSPDGYLLEAGTLLKAATEPLHLTIDNQVPALVPRYLAVALCNVRIGPSPVQMQSYLSRVGIRPINNVVDVTNYLMYLTGQGLHAFDYDKVAALDGKTGAAIVVRNPKPSEKLTLLDGRTIEPHQEAVLICSRHHPMAIGGVMGGAAAEVDESTKNVIIESANFNMFNIRKTSMEHGIFTDAVTRFSKGQSPEQTGVVLAEAVKLMGEHTGAQLATELGVAKPTTPPAIKTEVKFLNDRLGAGFTGAQIKHLLGAVEIDVQEEAQQLHITPPFWRTDLEIPEDIVEEVGRLHGFAQLPHTLPERSTEAVALPSIELLKTEVRNVLANSGNNELQTYSFISSKLLAKTGQDPKPAYRLRNALSPDLELIRTSLLPSLLEKIHPNHRANYSQFGLFEIGKSHNKFEIGHDELPQERLGLSYVFSAEPKAAAQWSCAPFYQAKYQLTHLLQELHISDYQFKLLESVQLEEWWLQNLTKLFEPKRAALLEVAGLRLGIIGEFTRSLQRNFKLPEFIAGFELDLARLHGISRPVSTYQPLLRFPATEQDICFKVAQKVTYADLEQVIRHTFTSDQRLRVQIGPVSIYQKEGDTEHKQITYRIRLQHHDRTLTTEEVNTLIQSIAERASKDLGAEVV